MQTRLSAYRMYLHVYIALDAYERYIRCGPVPVVSYELSQNRQKPVKDWAIEREH